MPSHYRPIINETIIYPGDIITDFRGHTWRFISLTSGNSKVFVEAISNPEEIVCRAGIARREFFPSVFKADIIEVSER